MCQYACFPAPKTVMFFKWVRRARSREDARAVRKAVTSSALRKPTGFPLLAMIVRAPCGVLSVDEVLVVEVVLLTDEEDEEGVGETLGATRVTTVTCQ